MPSHTDPSPPLPCLLFVFASFACYVGIILKYKFLPCFFYFYLFCVCGLGSFP
ncbi:hypothetical protein BDZ91DRAFT_747452 [Kalaharituber pfeilii]|nr:hypothetical protein BDZ91DRAFT_747452 [Kalaharituber pfeilii]